MNFYKSVDKTQEKPQVTEKTSMLTRKTKDKEIDIKNSLGNNQEPELLQQHRKERKGSINSPISWVNTTANLRSSFKSAKSGKKKALSKTRLNPKSSRQKLVESRQNLAKQHGRKLFMSHDFKADEAFRNQFFEESQKSNLNPGPTTKAKNMNKKKSLLNDCIIYEENVQMSSYRNNKKNLVENFSPN